MSFGVRPQHFDYRCAIWKKKKCHSDITNENQVPYAVGNGHKTIHCGVRKPKKPHEGAKIKGVECPHIVIVSKSLLLALCCNDP